ncbi:MAG: type II toxin-antitoxin system RelE/ParE family toxin [Vicinamibacterales bacterium]
MVTFVETKLFTKLVQEYLSDDEYAALQQSLIANQEAGDVIPGSGGVRKLRWAVAGRGKRGGIRVIYFLRLRHGEIWMLTLYAKNVADNIPAQTLKKIKEEIDAEGEAGHRPGNSRRHSAAQARRPRSSH